MKGVRTSTISESVEAGLRLIGMWPYCVHADVNWWTYIASVAVVQYFQYSYVFAHFDMGNFSDTIDGLSITFGYSLAFFKLINLWFNRRKLYVILAAMEQDWSDEIAIDPNIATMTHHADLSRQCSNVMITTNALAVFFYTIGGPILRSTINKGDHAATRELPLKMEFPFDVYKSPVFEVVRVAQLLHDLSVACIIAILNSLIVTLVLHVSGQIDIIRRGLLEISRNKHASKSSLAAIKLLVGRHQRIIDLSDNIEDLFSSIALLQFVWNTLVICCIGFVIVISIGTEEGATVITKSLIFYVAITLEAFVFCYAGEHLSAKSKSIGEAAYESLWYNLTPNECRILLFLILRSQKRLTITAGKVTDLSLESFTTILHVSGQIDIMRQDLAEISGNKYDAGTSLIVIKDLIYRHQKIISLSENIENLFSYIALMQLLWNTLVICCTGFVIIITIGTDVGITTLFKSVSFYIAITLEAFIFCFAGEFLSAKSKSIGDAVYESLWYDMPSSDSRILLFVILRSQKRLTITAGKVVDLTLEGFTSIMKASASYVSVLNAMY
ncbi:odorant receptor 82a-like [Harpegnathos saltator]|uniref:odorant receptor 82a-like n=1 Tax=Harpegnathos saltator TaxID=610380 RepID=UPI0009490964|nr:odorant receptor 82a-like [Harpegnathos saltator]